MGKIILSIVMVIFTGVIIYILSKKYKLNKNQKIIFWMLVLFWTSISIIRAYRKVYIVDPISTGGLGGSLIIASQVTSAYGLISCIVRLPVFFLTDILQKRKVFIQIAMGIIVVTSFTVFKRPSIEAVYYSSLAMGLGASMLAVFNVMFSETFSESNASVSASILAVAPLLAEFMAAPIQYIGTYGSYKNYNYLWLFSCTIGLISLIISMNMREIENKSQFSREKVRIVLTNKRFLLVCVIGIIISFVKFSTSGPNMIVYARKYLNMPAIMLAYLDTMFATPQLIASVLVGTYFKKKLGIEKTLLLSLGSFLCFYAIILFTNNPYLAFFGYIFNGFGYGGTYISLISIALQYFEQKNRNISMGIFQAFFAFGIFFGDRIYVVLSKSVKEDPKIIFVIVTIITIISMLVVFFKLVVKQGVRNER